jgi:hypothetical protein
MRLRRYRRGAPRHARRQAGQKVIAQSSAIKAGQRDAIRRDLEAPEVRKLIASTEAVYDSFGPTEGHAL